MPVPPRTIWSDISDLSCIRRRFSTIVADPPWPYNTSTSGSWAIPKAKGQESQRRVDQMGYSTLPLDTIKGLPVSSLANEPAHLYLWTTNAFIVEAHEVAKAWGFIPKTLLTWGKIKEDGSPSMKTGYYFRGATEHCLFAVRGSCKLLTSQGVPTLFLSRRLPHSVKPPWFYTLVEECSPGPRLELFSRKARRGWTVVGNQIH